MCRGGGWFAACGIGVYAWFWTVQGVLQRVFGSSVFLYGHVIIPGKDTRCKL